MIATTVDITQTGIRNKQTNDPDWLIKRNQQRNFDTLMQVIGLRTQPLNVHLYHPVQGIVAINAQGLYRPEEIRPQDVKVWNLHFEVEREGVFGVDGQLLLNDINGVPIVPNLTENVVSFPPTFMTTGLFKNVTLYQLGL